jgi:hypothetical protein
VGTAAHRRALDMDEFVGVAHAPSAARTNASPRSEE